MGGIDARRCAETLLSEITSVSIQKNCDLDKKDLYCRRTADLITGMQPFHSFDSTASALEDMRKAAAVQRAARVAPYYKGSRFATALSNESSSTDACGSQLLSDFWDRRSKGVRGTRRQER